MDEGTGGEVGEEPGPTEDTFALVERIQGGDDAALGRLVERYYPRIRRIVRIRTGGRLRDALEVDDLVQNILLRVLHGVETFERRSNAQFVHWVSRLASNEIYDQRRKLDRRPRDEGTDSALRQQLADETRSVVSRIANTEAEELVDSCITELSPDHQEVLILKDYADLSWAEIESELERPSRNACQALHNRAREALKERLERRGLGR